MRSAEEIVVKVLFCVHFVAWIFTIVALSQPLYMTNSYTGCITMWGYKNNCADTSISIDIINVNTCNEFQDRIYGGRVFAIFAMLTSMCGFFAHGINYLLRKPIFITLSKGLIVAVASCAGLATTLFASSFMGNLCNQTSLNGMGGFKYGAGFILETFAFVITLIAAFGLGVYTIICECKADDESAQTETVSKVADNEQNTTEPVA